MHASQNFPYQAQLALSVGMAALIALFLAALGFGWYEHELLLPPDTPRTEFVESMSLVLLCVLVFEGSISTCFQRRTYYAPCAGTLLAFTLFHALPLYLAVGLLLACALSWIVRVVR